jgi:hypothetical protein
MSDGNDVVYWFDGKHWTHGSAPVPDCPGPPKPGGVIYCGLNTWWISDPGPEGYKLTSHGENTPTFEPPPSAPLFTEATLVNGWVNFGSGFDTAGFRRHTDGTTELKGTVCLGKIAVAVFVLPPKLAPILQQQRLVLSGTGAARVDVGKSGSVIVQLYQGTGSNGRVDLGGYRFPAVP